MIRDDASTTSDRRSARTGAPEASPTAGPAVPAQAAGSPYVIASALRTLHVLSAFVDPPHRLGLAEVVAGLGLERNQAYRSLKTLEAAGYLTQDDEARFALGPAAFRLGLAGQRRNSQTLVEAAAPHLDAISAATRETVHLFVRSGHQAVCIDRRESPQSVRLVSVLGRSIPLHAGAVPKAMLAFLPADERAAVLAELDDLPEYTSATVLDRDRLVAQLDAIRERGYSVSDEDFDASARGVGAPILDADGIVVGGISVGGPSFRVDDDALDEFAQLVRAAAERISARLALSGRS